MGTKSLRYTASHEAGHADIACRNGFTLKSIILWRDPFLEKWEGAVQYQPKSWICGTCTATLCDAVGAEEFVQLNDMCSECREEQLRYISRCLAGGACTELLESRSMIPLTAASIISKHSNSVRAMPSPASQATLRLDGVHTPAGRFRTPKYRGSS